MTEQASLGSPVQGAPAVFIGFGPAQEVELEGTLGRGRLDRVADDQGAQAKLRKVGLEPAEVIVASPLGLHPVENRDNLPVEVERVEAQQAAAGEGRRGVAVEPFDRGIGQDAGLSLVVQRAPCNRIRLSSSGATRSGVAVSN